MPTLPGFVVTTEGVARGWSDQELLDQLHAGWQHIGGASAALVVRSSSTIEDAGRSSMAGRFVSVLDVRGWDALLAAVVRVVASADDVRDADGVARPIAVLVQPQLDAVISGVMFAVDPVTGARDRVVVEVVAGQPAALVGGVATADHYVLSARGRTLEHTTAAGAVPLAGRVRRDLVRLAERASRLFGVPQDLEWAVDEAGRLWLLQSRPVTAIAETGTGPQPILGPGPLAETFPEPLSRLSVDLWLDPLRDGMVRALSATRAASQESIARSPVVSAVNGRAAVDLELIGMTAPHRSWRRRISPSATARRLATAWRVGRLRVALPRLAEAILTTVDAHLSDLGALTTRSDDDLVDLLVRSRAELATVHSYEILCGMLARPGDVAPPAPLVALEALGRGRDAGLDDAEIVAAEPVVLTLSPPSLVHSVVLPVVAPRPSTGERSVDELSDRDGLRVRIRWLHELQTRIVLLLDRRWSHHTRLGAAGLVAHLSLAELQRVAAGGSPPPDLLSRLDEPTSAPLPPAFRLSSSGAIRAVHHRHRGRDGDGLAAGGGRGMGVVTSRPLIGVSMRAGEPSAGSVLVIEHLEPQLAGVLPHLAGLVGETGSALSHLAILAREMGVPTVVGVTDARRRFPPGTSVVVDGDAGTVDIVDPVGPMPSHPQVPESDAVVARAGRPS
ncbi:MAG: PEP/pyruvate-binding domain-containing protein [Actinomycetota bacterium]|nr:PEP/pyruvate-binding domain-containing protein [Actinomycetota bacterium]